nr:hypothetical protein [Tanacetum cinerariifolium]
GSNVLPKKLLDLDSTKDLHPPRHITPLSGSTTSSSPNHLLEEFADELAFITFLPEYDDDLTFDIESDLKEIEYLLHHDPIKDMDSILKDPIDQSNLADDNLVDTMPEMFTDEHALDYSSLYYMMNMMMTFLKLSLTLNIGMVVASAVVVAVGYDGSGGGGAGEMILRDGDERLTLNMRHDTSSYSNQPQKESIKLINVFNDSNEDFHKDLFSTNQPSGNLTFSSHPELTSSNVKNDIFEPEGGNALPVKLLDLDFTKDLHSPLRVKPLSGSSTSSSSPSQLLEEFADELALITLPPKYDDDLHLNDSIDQINLAGLNDNLVDSMPEMFTDEHAFNYSSPLLFDEYDEDLFEVESDTENVYDDPFDSKREKIKESKLLMDELDLPCDFLPSSEYDSFVSEDLSRVDALPSTNNEDKYSQNLKTHAKGFCPPVFISLASFGNHVSKSNRTNVYLLAYLINGLRFT